MLTALKSTNDWYGFPTKLHPSAMVLKLLLTVCNPTFGAPFVRMVVALAKVLLLLRFIALSPLIKILYASPAVSVPLVDPTASHACVVVFRVYSVEVFNAVLSNPLALPPEPVICVP